MTTLVGSSTALLLSQTSIGLTSPYTKTTNPYTGKTEYTYNAPAPISIDSDTLTAALNVGITGSTAATSAATPTSPTAPWSSTSQAPSQSALTQAAMGGASFYQPSAARLDAPAGVKQQDY